MSKIVLDNWTLELASQSLETTLGGNPIYNQEFISFVEAIILWDEPCYFDNGFQVVWNKRQDIVSGMMENVLTKLDMEKQHHLDIPSEIEGIVNRGALEYYLSCNRNGYGYLAIEQRAEFLCEYLNRVVMPQRMRVLNYFDEIQNNYMELNMNLLKNPIRFPSLFQLVLDNTEMPSDYINTALQLSESKEAKQFRELMNEIERCDVVKQQERILKLCTQIDKLFKKPEEKSTNNVILNVGFEHINAQIPIDIEDLQTKLRCGKVNLFRRMRDNNIHRNL